MTSRTRTVRPAITAMLLAWQVVVVLSLAGGLVLCVGTDGHLAFESGIPGHCCDGASGESTGFAHQANAHDATGATRAGSYCGTCVDVAAANQFQHATRASTRTHSAAMLAPHGGAACSSALLAVGPVGSNLTVTAAVGSTLSSLRTVVLRA